MRTPRSNAAALLALLLATPLVALAQTVTTPEAAHHLHHDVQAYIASLEDPSRDAYQKPDQVVAALELEAGQSVADIGSGSGYFSLRLASKLGPTGRLFAVDVEPEMVLYLNRRVRDAGVRNVQTLLAAPDDPLLPVADGSVDVFFICDTWHHIDAKERYLALMKTLLKPGGRVAMIDFKKEELPVGPPLGMKIARADLVQEMEGAGFRLAREHAFLPYQYFLEFTPTVR